MPNVNASSVRICLLVSLVLAFSAAAGPPPATNPALSAWAGKSIVIHFDLDLNEDGVPTLLETQYLAELLRQAGAKVRTYGDVKAKDDLLIIGRIAAPKKLVGEEADDPIAVERNARQQARYAKYPELVEAEKAQAAKVSVKVVLNDEVGATFKIGRPSDKEIRDAGIHFQRDVLARRIPEANFTGNALSDVLEFLTDVSGAPVIADWRTLASAGIDKMAPVSMRIRNCPLFILLELVADQAGGDKLVFVSDAEVIMLTTRADAARHLKAGTWLSLKDLAGPLEPSTDDLDAKMLRVRTAKLRFNGNALVDCIEFLQDLTGINVYFNRADLDAAKVKADAQVTLALDEPARDHAFAAVAAAVSPDGKLVFYCDRGYLLRLTTREKAEAAVKADKRSFLLPMKD